MNVKKTILVLLIFAAILSLTACTNRENTPNSTFPGIDNADIPDILEKTVGTLGNVSYSSGISDTPDYNAVLTVTFKDTTADDHKTLMEHYQSASTGTDENNGLLFDWGILHVSSDDSSITILALIK